MNLLVCFFKAWIIGISIAAPVGPIGLLCIKKTLEQGVRGSLAVGLGAALADSLYGIIAALGLSTISHFLLEKAVLIKIVGGAFLLYLAYKEAKGNNAKQAATASSASLGRLVSEIFFLTLTNPMTILSFIGIFASLSGGPTTASESLTMVFGIFCGSITWFLFLGSIVFRLRNRLPEAWLQRIKYLSAAIVGIFGLYAVISALHTIFSP